MSNPQTVSGAQILKRLPGLLPALPKLIKGVTIVNSRNKTKPLGLGICFEKAVKNNPDGLALKYQDREIRYREMNEWVNQIAHYFLSIGIKKGDCIAIMIENRPELLATVLASAKIGAISAMINTGQKGKVLAHSIDIVNPKLMIVGEECLQAYEAVRSQNDLNHKQHLYFADTNTLTDPGQCPENWLNLATCISCCEQTNLVQTQHIFSEDPCFYIYTSGTSIYIEISHTTGTQRNN